MIQKQQILHVNRLGPPNVSQQHQIPKMADAGFNVSPILCVLWAPPFLWVSHTIGVYLASIVFQFGTNFDVVERSHI